MKLLIIICTNRASSSCCTLIEGLFRVCTKNIADLIGAIEPYNIIDSNFQMITREGEEITGSLQYSSKSLFIFGDNHHIKEMHPRAQKNMAKG